MLIPNLSRLARGASPAPRWQDTRQHASVREGRVRGADLGGSPVAERTRIKPYPPEVRERAVRVVSTTRTTIRRSRGDQSIAAKLSINPRPLLCAIRRTLERPPISTAYSVDLSDSSNCYCLPGRGGSLR
jgi:hypothetical protein